MDFAVEPNWLALALGPKPQPLLPRERIVVRSYTPWARFWGGCLLEGTATARPDMANGAGSGDTAGGALTPSAPASCSARNVEEDQERS